MKLARRGFLSGLATLVLARFAPPMRAPIVEAAAPAIAPVVANTARAVFRGGTFRVSLLIKGFEVTDAWQGYVDRAIPRTLGDSPDERRFFGEAA